VIGADAERNEGHIASIENNPKIAALPEGKLTYVKASQPIMGEDIVRRLNGGVSDTTRVSAPRERP
jgi:hypothetical protein